MTSVLHIPVDGGVLAVERREGPGTPLVLIHGFGGSMRDWDAVIAALSAERPLLAYDQRGFGASSAAKTASYAHADDLLALLDASGIARADLCGISLGGGTALTFALNHPDRVRRLVLVSPLMAGWRWSTNWIDRWKAIGCAARMGDMPTARELWWRHPLFDAVRDMPAAQGLRASIAGFHGDQWVHDGQRAAAPDLPRLGSLSMPVLVLSGGRDIADFRDIADAIAGAGVNVSHRRYRDAGHMLNLERPRDLADAMEAFLPPARAVRPAGR